MMLERLKAITYSIYRCEECQAVRQITELPAILEGVIQESSDEEFLEALDCSECQTRNVTLLFRTKDVEAALAYLPVVQHLEGLK